MGRPRVKSKNAAMYCEINKGIDSRKYKGLEKLFGPDHERVTTGRLNLTHL